jgi:hypothetical protein
MENYRPQLQKGIQNIHRIMNTERKERIRERRGSGGDRSKEKTAVKISSRK